MFAGKYALCQVAENLACIIVPLYGNALAHLTRTGLHRRKFQPACKMLHCRPMRHVGSDFAYDLQKAIVCNAGNIDRIFAVTELEQGLMQVPDSGL